MNQPNEQPKLPCKHVMELIDLAIDNEVGVYLTREESTNIYCKRCNKGYEIDISAFSKKDNTGFQWEETL